MVCIDIAIYRNLDPSSGPTKWDKASRQDISFHCNVFDINYELEKHLLDAVKDAKCYLAVCTCRSHFASSAIIDKTYIGFALDETGEDFSFTFLIDPKSEENIV